MKGELTTDEAVKQLEEWLPMVEKFGISPETIQSVLDAVKLAAARGGGVEDTGDDLYPLAEKTLLSRLASNGGTGAELAEVMRARLLWNQIAEAKAEREAKGG